MDASIKNLLPQLQQMVVEGATATAYLGNDQMILGPYPVYMLVPDLSTDPPLFMWLWVDSREHYITVKELTSAPASAAQQYIAAHDIGGTQILVFRPVTDDATRRVLVAWAHGLGRAADRPPGAVVYVPPAAGRPLHRAVRVV